MRVELKDLKETNKPISEIEAYLDENGSGIGFIDTDGQFKAVVMDNGKMRKKRIPRHDIKPIKLPSIDKLQEQECE